MAEQDTIIQVRLPETLRSMKLRSRIWIALFYLSLGNRPAHIPGEGEKRTNTKIRLGPEGKKIFDELLSRPDFTSKNQIILHALAFLYERPLLQISNSENT
jgi:hypothetical protein